MPETKDHPMEFGGPIGGAVLSIALPLLVFALYFACTTDSCSTIPSFPSLDVIFATVFSHDTVIALVVYCVWFLTLVVLYFVAPGDRVQGVELPDGSRLTYPINGFRSMLVVLIALGALHFTGFFNIAWFYHNFVHLAAAAIFFSVALSVFLYLYAQRDGIIAAAPGNTGNVFNDFFMGRELNPRVFGLDLKYFCELRPGLILWLILDLSMLAEEYQRTGTVSAAMALVVLFQGYYVFDALWNEECILTTMDITSDGFGMMLAFGDLSWVPFTYTLQCRFLVDHPISLPTWAIVGICVVEALGMWLFRGANSQKNTFRNDPTDPSVAHLETIETARGTKLIASGYWGWARHINYFGDWLMAWAWCLPTGFSTVIPYFYVIYFGALLVHRERRDEHKCRTKYGSDWEKYCSRVPWRIIPYVY